MAAAHQELADVQAKLAEARREISTGQAPAAPAQPTDTVR
jgi:hypothetical protein